jgi:hypothetical protein
MKTNCSKLKEPEKKHVETKIIRKICDVSILSSMSILSFWVEHGPSEEKLSGLESFTATGFPEPWQP